MSSARKRPRPDIPVATERKSGVDRRAVAKSFLREQFSSLAACDYTADQVTFMKAVDEYKRTRGRPFPTWAEVLAVVLSLGYRKVADPTPLPDFKKTVDPTPAPSARK